MVPCIVSTLSPSGLYLPREMAATAEDGDAIQDMVDERCGHDLGIWREENCHGIMHITIFLKKVYKLPMHP